MIIFFGSEYWIKILFCSFAITRKWIMRLQQVTSLMQKPLIIYLIFYFFLSACYKILLFKIPSCPQTHIHETHCEWWDWKEHWFFLFVFCFINSSRFKCIQGVLSIRINTWPYKYFWHMSIHFLGLGETPGVCYPNDESVVPL